MDATSTNPDPAGSSTSFCDVEQLGLIAAIASLGYVFWVVGAMEMVERLAFFGVKAVATLYAKDPASEGGLGVSLTKFGTLLSVWAFVQTMLPVFTGGLSDRFGYKETILCSTVLKIVGYLLMAWFPSYWGFFAGALVLATGTAIFKPGIQGTLVRTTNRRNSSVAWGIFYQTVNIGGFLGPLVAGLLRKMDWAYVFYACAAIISLNFLLLLTYREVGRAERLERNRAAREGRVQRPSLARESLRELVRPHVWTYLLIFSGFWFMFMALFDVLPAYIDDWVNTSDILRTLFPDGRSRNPVLNFLVITDTEGTAIQPEGMLNLNAGMIMMTCFLFAWASGRLRATSSMVLGTLLASAAMFLLGWSALGWVSLSAIAIFSIGEMLSSPKFSEFIGNFAPHDKKAMYLGFSQIPIAIGWTLEGKVGLSLYEIFASKDRFARELLVDRIRTGAITPPRPETWAELARRLAVTPESLANLFHRDAVRFADSIPKGEAFDWLTIMTRQAPRTLTDILHTSHHVGTVWYVMAGVGVATAFGIWTYGKWILTLRSSR
jgi:dipeptide/tripeptide permease